MGHISFDGGNDDTAERWTRRRCTGASISSRVRMAAKDDTPQLCVSSSSPPVTTSWSSLASSADPPNTTSTTRREKVRRHPIFHHTNAVSKSFPVPHPDLWTRSLGKTPSYPSFHQHFSLLPMSLSGIIAPSAQIINDVRVEFTDPMIGARQLLLNSGIIFVPGGVTGNESSGMAEEERKDTMDHLANVLSYFQSIVSPPCAFSTNDNGAEECNVKSNRTRQPVPCVARIVSTIGKVGTKCPRWHADHVPVRLIMSLVGPGCEYVHEESSVGLGDCSDGAHGESGNDDYHCSHENRIRTDQQLELIVNRFALNNLDEEDTVKANNIIVRTKALSSIQASMPLESKGGAYSKNMITTIKHAKEGEAVLLMGKGWEEGVGEDDKDRMEEQETILDYDHAILAAVHRSPKLRPNQERILLTVDLA